MAFLPFADGHATGTYPLPDPERYETTTTLVNLGEEEATVVAQAYWRGGTYALRPFVVPAAASHRIRLDDLSEAAPPDPLGRELDPERPHGILKWVVQEGPTELIARTEVRPRTGSDRFGFNCNGCCFDFPFGVIVPEFVEFTQGESRLFEASLIHETCSGSMGPFPTTPGFKTVPAPFQWDATTVTASEAADADISFEKNVSSVRIDCTTILKRLLGFGRAELCKKTFNPRGYDPQKTCSSQTGSCIECRACCHNISQMQICQGKNPDTVLQNQEICLGICFNDHNCN